MAAEIDTNHVDMIHDAQLDYYGKRLATCSSDRTIKIFDVTENEDGQETHALVKELRGHEGPVWQLSWSHPSHGSMIATCSYDKKVIVWKETDTGWELSKELTGHSGSVNSVAWGPYAVDRPLLASASSDGTVMIHEMKADGSWESTTIKAHESGAMSVTWAPGIVQGVLGEVANRVNVRLATGGCDKVVKIWQRSDSAPYLGSGGGGSTAGSWQCVNVLGGDGSGHSHWVRDVAWNPNASVGTSSGGGMVASCGQDGMVFIWTQDDKDERNWTCKELWSSDKAQQTGPIWRVSWSLTGNLLAVSSSENKVTLWKQSLTNEWECINELTQPE